MNKLLAVLAVFLICAGAFAAEFVTDDGSVRLRSKTISMNKKAVNASGGATLLAQNDTSSLSAECEELKLVYSGKQSKGLDAVSQAVIKKSVVLVYKSGESVYNIWCDSAFYENSLLTLAGNVKIEYTDGSAPMTATGSRAMINLSRDAGEDETIFSIEGDPERARITVPLNK